MTKLLETLTSRRFVSSVASAAVAVLCFRGGLITGGELAEWLEATFGLYTGAVGLEHVVKVARAKLEPGP